MTLFTKSLLLICLTVAVSAVAADLVSASTLTVSCTSSPSSSLTSPLNLNAQVTFTSTVSGGTGNVSYTWFGSCTGNATTCQNTFSSAGTYTAYVTVNDGGNSQTANCTAYVNVSQSCTPNTTKQCVGNAVYNYDSCGTQGLLYQQCASNQTCINGYCQNSYVNNCTQNSYQQCIGNYLYWYDSCGNQIGSSQFCPNGCSGNTCSNNRNCTQNAYQTCVGNYLSWLDSCGNQTGMSQYCPNGCSGNICLGNPNIINPVSPFGDCTYHAYKLCSGNNVYWYDSCGNQQDIVQNCSLSGLICKYGSCSIKKYYPVYPNVILNKPIKTIPTVKPAVTPAVTDNQVLVSFFVKKDTSVNQWQKTVEVSQNGQTYFMINVLNNSPTPKDNVIISVNIPKAISSLGEVKMENVLISGDIVSGINIGTLAGKTAKSITFTGKSQTFSDSDTKEATATLNASGIKTQTDHVSIILNPKISASSETYTSPYSGTFWTFLKRWYLWIFVAIALVFLFIIVFRRLSNS